jgi:hypothetical protein
MDGVRPGEPLAPDDLPLLDGTEHGLPGLQSRSRRPRLHGTALSCKDFDRAKPDGDAELATFTEPVLVPLRCPLAFSDPLANWWRGDHQ